MAAVLVEVVEVVDEVLAAECLAEPVDEWFAVCATRPDDVDTDDGSETGTEP